jgi:hypothetical protein
MFKFYRDFVGICVHRVPNQFRDGGNWLSLRLPFEEIGLDLDAIFLCHCCLTRGRTSNCIGDIVSGFLCGFASGAVRRASGSSAWRTARAV